MNQQAMMKLRKMQKEMMETQKRLESTSFIGTAGGGIVKAEVLGNHTVVKIEIDRDSFESQDDIEMIEDSVVAAINDAFKKVESETEKAMAPYTAGLPGGLF